MNSTFVCMFLIHRLKHLFWVYFKLLSVWDNDCLLMFVTFIQRLVSVGLDGHATINVWDWKKGKIIATVRGHSDRVSFIN